MVASCKILICVVSCFSDYSGQGVVTPPCVGKDKSTLFRRKGDNGNDFCDFDYDLTIFVITFANGFYEVVQMYDFNV